uniref:Uncharacterized protein n=1 Tax=Arundo donax TaxID=35708 RepID=A0A0A9G412_ARUDO
MERGARQTKMGSSIRILPNSPCPFCLSEHNICVIFLVVNWPC